jgi:hypothetical protein
VPLAIISAMVRRSSSVMPGLAAGWFIAAESELPDAFSACRVVSFTLAESAATPAGA